MSTSKGWATFTLLTPERIEEIRREAANAYELAARREQLREESHTIHKTIMLHHEGIAALMKREDEVEAEIAAIDDEMEVSQ